MLARLFARGVSRSLYRHLSFASLQALVAWLSGTVTAVASLSTTGESTKLYAARPSSRIGGWSPPKRKHDLERRAVHGRGGGGGGARGGRDSPLSLLAAAVRSINDLPDEVRVYEMSGAIKALLRRY